MDEIKYNKDNIKNLIICGDSLSILKQLPDDSIEMCCTSPPYFGLRSYLADNDPNKYLEIGFREQSPEEYIQNLVDVFHEVKRVLKKGSVCYINISDSYNGSGKNSYKSQEQIDNNIAHACSTSATKVKGCKPKDLIGIPWMLAFALRDDGWYWRDCIIWEKGSCMPESVKSRTTKSHEYILIFANDSKYYYDYEAILEPAAYDNRSDTKYKGGKSRLNSEDPNVFNNGTKERERWPNKIRGYVDKPNGNGLAPQHHGHNVQCTNTIKIFDDDPVLDKIENQPTPRLFGAKHQEGTMRNDVGRTWIDQPARNKRSVWHVNPKPDNESHFAMYPEMLITPCILAGCPVGGIVLDPFMGGGTTAIVAKKLGRYYAGCELNPDYIKIAERRLFRELGLWTQEGSEM